jgi:TonB-linked SusC/RagA family outer membrane protein
MQVMQLTAVFRTTQLVKFMKLTTLFLLAACLQVSAKGISQSITYSAKNAKLEQVFSEIKKQSGYVFLYTYSALERSKPVTVHIKNADIKNTLSAIFKDQPLDYKIESKTIVISEKKFVTPNENGKQTFEMIALAIDVHGRVVNENGEPIAGVSVIIKGSKRGVATNENGEFELKGVNDDATLVFSAVNIITREMKLEGKTEISIIARSKISTLDDIVINKGYYSSTRRNNTGSVVKISNEVIEKNSFSNVLSSIQGRATGVFITQNNGLPGSNFKVQIRGQNSIQQGNEPLYVIDGIPYPSVSFSQLGGTNANSPLQAINPLLIESVEILKDADATAIYGSRGANGVVLITTKLPKNRKLGIDIAFSEGWGNALYNMPLLDNIQYVRMRREAFANDAISPTINNAYDFLAWDTSRYTDWKKILIGNTSRTSNYSLRISEGKASTQFTLGANYAKETSVFSREFGNQRSTIDLGLTHRSVNNKLKFSINGSYGFDVNTLPPGDMTSYILRPPTMYFPYDSDGNLVWLSNGFSLGNPMADLKKEYIAKTNRLTGRLLIDYTLQKNLLLRTSLGINSYILDEKSKSPIFSQNPSLNPKGSAGFATSKSGSWIIETSLEYQKSISDNKGTIKLLAGSSIQQNRESFTRISASGYVNDLLLETVTAAGSLSITDGSSLYRYKAAFARVNFDWKAKYLFNLTARRDGSTRFGPANRTGDFGSIGAAWIFSDEKLFAKSNALSFGKLRASYGITGNDQVGDYKYLDLYSPTTYPFGSTPGLRSTQLFNPNYGWEKIKKTEIALELGFFDNRFSLNVSGYKNVSDNQYIATSLPSQVGFTSITQSFPGVVENRGLETEVFGKILDKTVKLKANFNITFSENILRSFPGLQTSNYSNRYIEGKPINLSFGYQFLGVDPTSGVYMFEDVNKDGILNSTGDYQFIGTTNPRYFGGLGLDGSYKGWALNFFLQFVKQNGTDPIYGSVNRPGTIFNMPVELENRWKSTGDKVPYQKVSATAGKPAFIASGQIFSSSARMTDASFIRLKNVEISYTLSSKFLQSIKATKAKFFAQGSNLLTWTKFSGADPETQSSSVLPPIRTLTVGAQLQF